MDRENELAVHECVDCGVRSPSDASEYTLFSSQHGWRLTKRTLADGKSILDWRCPDCFAKHRVTERPERSERLSEAP